MAYDSYLHLDDDKIKQKMYEIYSYISSNKFCMTRVKIPF